MTHAGSGLNLRVMVRLRLPLALFLGSLLLRLVWLAVSPYALYPDAAYYDAGARALAAGELEVPFLWSWIETGFVIPERLTLPMTAFIHWGPLASIIGVPFVWLFGALPFAPALPHLLAGALLAPVTYLLALRLGATRPLDAGLLALVGGLYGPLLSQPDNYALYALLATAALVVTISARGGQTRRWFAAGLLAGLAWLSRTDGLILAGSIGLLALAEPGLRSKGRAALGVILGFTLLTLPWLIRQIVTFGSPIPSGSSGALWIRSYNEQFTADGPFTIGHLFADGLLPVLSSRLEAAGFFLFMVVLFLLTVSLLPGLISGMIARRRDRRLAPFAVYAIAYALWSILFAASHLKGGNLMHGLLALGPIAWVISSEGLYTLLQALQRRGLLRSGADRRIGRFVLALVLLIGLFGPLRGTFAVWRVEEQLAQEITLKLSDAGLDQAIIMSVRPTALWRVGGAGNVMLPLGSTDAVIRALRATAAGVLILDPAYRQDLIDLWGGPERPDWLGTPIELVFRGEESPRTLLIVPVIGTPSN